MGGRDYASITDEEKNEIEHVRTLAASKKSVDVGKSCRSTMKDVLATCTTGATEVAKVACAATAKTSDVACADDEREAYFSAKNIETTALSAKEKKTALIEYSKEKEDRAKQETSNVMKKCMGKNFCCESKQCQSNASNGLIISVSLCILVCNVLLFFSSNTIIAFCFHQVLPKQPFKHVSKLPHNTLHQQ